MKVYRIINDVMLTNGISFSGQRFAIDTNNHILMEWEWKWVDITSLIDALGEREKLIKLFVPED